MSEDDRYWWEPRGDADDRGSMAAAGMAIVALVTAVAVAGTTLLVTAWWWPGACP